MTNTKMLRDEIDKRGLKYKYVASSLGLTYYGLLRKIENCAEFKASEIVKISDILSLDMKTRDRIFFAK